MSRSLKHSGICTAVLALLSTAAMAAQQTPRCDTGATIAGFVTDAETGVGLPGATVTISAEDATVLATVTTDATGAFRWCSADAVRGSILASVGPYASDSQVFEAAVGEAIALALALSFAGDAPTVTTAPSAVGQASTGERAGIVGTVIDRSSGLGVAGAAVRVEAGGAEVVTDSAGRFGPLSAAAGSTAIEVRRLGFGAQRVPVTLERGRTTVVTVRVDPRPVSLEPIEVTVEGIQNPRLEKAGFYERKRWADALSLGAFIEEEDIRQRGAARVSHMLESVPLVKRLRFCDSGHCAILVTMAGAPRRNVNRLYLPDADPFRWRPIPGVECPADVYVNGVRSRLFYWGTEPGGSIHIVESIDDLVNIAEVAAVEVYRRPAEMPARFGGAIDGCGAVVIWTR